MCVALTCPASGDRAVLARAGGPVLVVQRREDTRAAARGGRATPGEPQATHVLDRPGRARRAHQDRAEKAARPPVPYELVVLILRLAGRTPAGAWSGFKASCVGSGTGWPPLPSGRSCAPTAFHRLVLSALRLRARIAGLCAFSLVFRVTQRDAGIAVRTFWTAGSCCGPATWAAAAASTATCWAWPSAGSSARRTILGRGSSSARDCSGSPVTRPSLRGSGDDLAPGARCPRRARPAGRGRRPGHPGAATESWGPTEMQIQNPGGLRIVLVEVPADHPVRRDPRSASPPK